MDVTDQTFQADVLTRSAEVPVVVDLWAPWCGPCKTLGPMLEKAVADTDGAVALAKVNVDENPQISQAFQVQGIPAVYALKDGKVVDRLLDDGAELPARAAPGGPEVDDHRGLHRPLDHVGGKGLVGHVDSHGVHATEGAASGNPPTCSGVSGTLTLREPRRRR